MTKDVKVTVEFNTIVHIDDDVCEDDYDSIVHEQVEEIVRTTLEYDRNVSFVDILSIKE